MSGRALGWLGLGLEIDACTDGWMDGLFAGWLPDGIRLGELRDYSTYSA